MAILTDQTSNSSDNSVRSSAQTLSKFRSDPLGFLRGTASTDDPAVQFRIGRTAIVLLNHPDLIEQVLVTDQEKYKKGPGLLRARSVLGEGLLTADGERHRERRRSLQPAFHRNAVSSHLPEMIAQEDLACTDWESGDLRDIHQEMGRLTLGVAAATIFGSRTPVNVSAVTTAVTEALSAVYGPLSVSGSGGHRSGCPHAAAASRKALDEAAASIVSGFRPGAAPSLPEILAQDVADGLSETEAMDEAVTFLIAGHESVANALTWTWVLLAQHPEWERAFHEEIDSLGAEAISSLAGLETLSVTRNILSESMRLYPPAWMVSRESLEPVYIGEDGPYPAGTVVIAAQCVAHHDERYYPNPDVFDPDRWLPETAAARPRYAYFPFGGGPRLCIGERFAWTELMTTLVVLGRTWKFRLKDSHVPVPDPVVTLRPRDGAPMEIERR